LKQHSKALSPPHHLNFLNPKSVTSLLRNVGFDVLEAITPGKLDIDIIKKNRQFIGHSYWENLFGYLTADEQNHFQDFISQSGLSSHMMITCRK
jgi:hypothetical protein